MWGPHYHTLKMQKLFLHDFVALCARQLLLFVNLSQYKKKKNTNEN